MMQLTCFLPAETELALVAADDKDRAWLRDLHRASMREAVVATWGGWDEVWQAARWAQRLRLERIWLIQRQMQPVGMVECSAEAGVIALHNLQIAPDWQARGIGGAVVSALQRWAASERGTLQLQVLAGNRRALRFYRRLGLVTTGIADRRISMRWPPGA